MEFSSAKFASLLTYIYIAGQETNSHLVKLGVVTGIQVLFRVDVKLTNKSKK